ncbi:MAG: wax ester/triacylglycerol synthase domain-containing protein [Rhodococcus sp. (in: high G+C Gram-positive bacteria)]
MTKLDTKDAAFHFLRAEGGPTDMYGIYVFDSGDGRAPSFDEVLAHVAERVPNIPALNVVSRESVLNLDFPSWVVSAARVNDHLSDHDLDGGSWDECQRLVSTFLEAGVDARVRPWHLHVIRGVEGVPTVRGRATVVVLQATHALTDGLGLARLSGALFASAPELPISVGKRNVVSVDRGPAVLQLCGSSVAFTCGTPMLTEERSVVHGFFGVGDVVTVVVLACPDTVPDHVRYRDLLLETVEEMSGAVEVSTQ